MSRKAQAQYGNNFQFKATIWLLYINFDANSGQSAPQSFT